MMECNYFAVDDHFAKALGPTWNELKARNSNLTPPPAPIASTQPPIKQPLMPLKQSEKGNSTKPALSIVPVVSKVGGTGSGIHIGSSSNINCNRSTPPPLATITRVPSYSHHFPKQPIITAAETAISPSLVGYNNNRGNENVAPPRSLPAVTGTVISVMSPSNSNSSGLQSQSPTLPAEPNTTVSNSYTGTADSNKSVISKNDSDNNATTTDLEVNAESSPKTSDSNNVEVKTSNNETKNTRDTSEMPISNNVNDTNRLSREEFNS